MGSRVSWPHARALGIAAPIHRKCDDLRACDKAGQNGALVLAEALDRRGIEVRLL